MQPDTFETIATGPGQRAFDELELAEKLPSIPGLCLSVLNLTHEGQESNEALIDCVRADPALTGRLIHLANSGRAAGIAPVTSVRAAAGLLDSAAVRTVALSFHLVPKEASDVCQGFDHRRHWLISLACAASAEALARRFRSGDPEEAFTLGLLAHAGVFAMAAVHPTEFSQVLRECAGKDAGEFTRAELNALRIHHWQVAADLMREWGMPESCVAPLVALAEVARDGTQVDAMSAHSASLLSLALELANEIVETSTGSPPGTVPLATWSRAARRTEDPTNESRSARAEIAPARDEALRRWRELVELCGLDGGSRVHDENGATKPHAKPAGTGTDFHPAPGAARAQSAHPASRILVVDDDPGARHLTGLHLRRAGYDVIPAQDGEAGLRAALAESPQIVITDWLMPGLSGLDLCKSLRRTEAGRKVYLILLTSREEEDSVIEGLEAGANDYLTKPFNPRILLARVNAGQRVIDMQRQIEMDKQVDKRRVSEMAKMTRRLHTLHNQDVLTGLPNRRHAMDQLKDAWNVAVRSNRPLSVVMIDIDHFKRVNDINGHSVGDGVLKATAEVLRSRCRRSEVVYRLGGEEFLLICMNAGMREGLICAERLRASVESNRIVFPGFDGQVTVSLGVAERTPTMSSFDDLVNAADRAVYLAKARGRNQVCGDEAAGGELAKSA